MLARITQRITELDNKPALVMKALAGLGIFFAFSAVFAYMPSSPYLYSDWPYFWVATRLVLRGQSLYGQVESLYFFNPPWVAVLLVPFGLFSAKFSAGMATSLSLILMQLLSRRFKLSLVNTVLFGLSPPVLTILLLGQIDLIILGGILLPVTWWPLVAFSKPQTALGIGFHSLQQPYFKKAFLTTAFVTGTSFLVFGFWPLEILNLYSPTQFDWNIWKNVWPWPLIPGVILVGFGLWKKQVNYLISASPFLMPYTTISGFAGPLLIVFSCLKKWQAGLFFLVIWVFVVILEPGY